MESDNTRDRDDVYAKDDANHSQASTTWSSPPSSLSLSLSLFPPPSFFLIVSVSVTWLKLVTWIEASVSATLYASYTAEMCERGGDKQGGMQCQRPSFTQLTRADQIPLSSTDTASYSILTGPLWSSPKSIWTELKEFVFSPWVATRLILHIHLLSLRSVNENRQK